MPKKSAPAPTPALRRVDLDALILWEANYNQGDVGAIAVSIRKFGLNNVPRIWRGLQVRGGNHTTLALRQIKQEGPRPDLDREWPPQHVYVDGDRWEIDAMDIGDLSEAEAVGFAIADNRTASLASQDEDALLKHLLSLSEADDRLLLATGYDHDELDRLNQLLGEPIVGENFNKSPQEALDYYLNGAVKQIVLYFDANTYLQTVERLTAIMTARDLDSNTSTILHLLDFYEQHGGMPDADHRNDTQTDQPEPV